MRMRIPLIAKGKMVRHDQEFRNRVAGGLSAIPAGSYT